MTYPESLVRGITFGTTTLHLHLLTFFSDCRFDILEDISRWWSFWSSDSFLLADQRPPVPEASPRNLALHRSTSFPAFY